MTSISSQHSHTTTGGNATGFSDSAVSGNEQKTANGIVTNGPDSASIQAATNGLTEADKVMKAGRSDGENSELRLMAQPDSVAPEQRTHARKALSSLTLSNSVGTDIYALMAAFQRSAQEMRNANREIRASESNAQVSTLLAAADEMKTAANFRLAAGITQGAFQFVSGMVQFSASAAAGAHAGRSANLGEQATKAESLDKWNTDATKATALSDNAASLRQQSDTAMAKSQAYSGSGKSTSDMAIGAGGMFSALFTSFADTHDIAAKRLDAQAKLHETASQQAGEMAQQMMDVIRDIRDKLQSIDQSLVETNRGIARNI